MAEQRPARECPALDPVLTLLPESLADLLAGQQTAAARTLYAALHRTTSTRLRYRVHSRYSDLFSSTDEEDLTSEIMCVLLYGALQGFRGTSQGELISFVRTIVDRHLWRAARRRIRERGLLETHAGEAADAWGGTTVPPALEVGLRAVSESPLPTTDADYLLGLLRAGSQASFAREQRVSRAAVTQRIQRIRRRIDGLTPAERDLTRTWLSQNVPARPAAP